METIQPIRKDIYETAKKLGVKRIHLNFSGGSDEGHLNVDLDYNGEWNSNLSEFMDAVQNWAWDVYSYNGAGDGNDYGDDIVYNLEDNTASCSEWYTSRVDGESENMKLEIDNNE